MDDAARNQELMRRARDTRLLALDVDGVLTDGGVYVLEDGTEFRRFDIKDGLGLQRLMACGIQVAIISASTATPVVHRAARLGISRVYLGAADKLETLQTLCAELGLSLDQVAYMGDDLTDLPVLECVGLACAPIDAAPIVRRAAVLITQSPGGQGAVRELTELLMAASEAQAAAPMEGEEPHAT